MADFQYVTDFIKTKFPNRDFIGLHEPVFMGNERKYVLDAIDSTFVSSVGAYVNRFEAMMQEITGAKHAVAMVNGTNALHMGLILAGVKRDEEVISQALTFIATANAISYIGAKPLFIDVDRDTLGMSPSALLGFLEQYAHVTPDGTFNKLTGKRIAACVPMHTFGLPCRIDEIAKICTEWNIVLVEDAAESLGSCYKTVHTGRLGKMGIFSFNGNKTVTAGGGGALITDDEDLARIAKHLTTQAKVPHKWDFVHDAVGYNYRMPNLNAALACAQLEQLHEFIDNKRELAHAYHDFFEQSPIQTVKEVTEGFSNYWLNAVLLENLEERNSFLTFLNENGVMARPVWALMSNLEMFKLCWNDGLSNSKWISDRLVNIPSGVKVK